MVKQDRMSRKLASGMLLAKLMMLQAMEMAHQLSEKMTALKNLNYVSSFTQLALMSKAAVSVLQPESLDSSATASHKKASSGQT